MFVITHFVEDRLMTNKHLFSNASDTPLRVHVDRAMRYYFSQLDGQSPSEVYDLVMAEVERPMLSVILEHTRGNQTKAADMLGLNRGTLRKKLKQHGLMTE